MKFLRLSSLILLSVFTIVSCNNSLKPKEGRNYVQIDKGLMLPVPCKNDSTIFDYSKVKVTFEFDGVYMRTKEIMQNAMMSVEFKTPQYKTTFGSRDYSTRIGLEFKDTDGNWYVYYAPYSDFRKYSPYWTWDDVEGIRFVYQPESYKSVYLDISDFESLDDYFKAKRKLGFEYEIIIYKDFSNLEMLNDPDFESVFKLFRAHIK